MFDHKRGSLRQLENRILELEAENKDLKYELDSYKWQMEEIRKQQDEIRTLHQNTRKLKHDMRNHLMVVTSYINNGDHEGAENYVSSILEKLNAVRSYVETGNPLLNHILNSKLETAREAGIDVKVEIGKASFDRMKEIDFSAVFANAIDNAIEKELTEERKELVIRVYENKGYDVISVRNRIAGSVLDTNPELKSTKEDKDRHGYGVSGIREIVEEYDGLTDIYEEDGFFVLNMFIPK